MAGDHAGDRFKFTTYSIQRCELIFCRLTLCRILLSLSRLLFFFRFVPKPQLRVPMIVQGFFLFFACVSCGTIYRP